MSEECEKFDGFNMRNRMSSGVAMSTSEINKRDGAVVVIWDVENCNVQKNFQAEHFVSQLHCTFKKDNKTGFDIYTACNVHEKDTYVKNGLISAEGLTVDWHEGGKDETDKRLVNALKSYIVIHNPQPEKTELVLISGDGGFKNTLKEYVSLGFKCTLIYPKNSCKKDLKRLKNIKKMIFEEFWNN